MERTKDFRKLAKRLLMVGGIIVLALVLLVLVSSEEGEAATINVPGDYPTISQAITAANPGDTINVGAGTYNEHLVRRQMQELEQEARARQSEVEQAIQNEIERLFTGFQFFGKQRRFPVVLDLVSQPLLLDLVDFVQNLF